MEFCPKSSWQCPESLSLGSVPFSALPCSGSVLCALGAPTLEQWQIFPPGAVFCSKVAVISGGGRTRVRAGRCWGTHSPFPGHRAVVSGSGQECWSSPSAAQGSRPWSLPCLCGSPSAAWFQLWGFCTTWGGHMGVRAETVSWERLAAQNEVLPQAANGNPSLIFFCVAC